MPVPYVSLTISLVAVALTGILHGITASPHSWQCLAPFATRTKNRNGVTGKAVRAALGTVVGCSILGFVLGKLGARIPHQVEVRQYANAVSGLFILIMGLSAIFNPEMLHWLYRKFERHFGARMAARGLSVTFDEGDLRWSFGWSPAEPKKQKERQKGRKKDKRGARSQSREEKDAFLIGLLSSLIPCSASITAGLAAVAVGQITTGWVILLVYGACAALLPCVVVSLLAAAPARSEWLTHKHFAHTVARALGFVMSAFGIYMMLL